MASIPQLARMPHPWLRQFLLVNLWLEPHRLLYVLINQPELTCVENENVIYYPLFPISLSASKDYEVLTKLSRRMTISSSWGLPIYLYNSDYFPSLFIRGELE